MEPSDLNDELTRMLRQYRGISDINFTVGKPPQVETNGDLKPVDSEIFGDALTRSELEEIAQVFLKPQHLRDQLERNGSVDCAYTIPSGHRFRANIFRARSAYSVVLRVLAAGVPTLESLGLPPITADIAGLRNGLVLVTGATGSGKSTTLAALIDRINATRPAHIVTLEDPIEFVHPHKVGTVNQREQGIDFLSFSAGLRDVLRQAPKVIQIGEMRDRETVEIGLKAAETGQLVFSTLHTIDAGQSIERIIGMFNEEERSLVRVRLAQVLRFILAQRLLPTVQGDRSAAIEILGSSMRTRELIEQGESEGKTFQGVIADARSQGWQTFDQHILELFQRGVISDDVALAYCTDRGEMSRALDRVHAAAGQETSSLGELEMASVTPEKEELIMALFGSELSGLLKKLQTTPRFAAGELESLLENIGLQPDFSLDQFPWLITFPNKKVRSWIAEYARTFTSPQLVELLIQQLTDQQDSELRAEISQLIMGLSPERVLPHLGRMIHARKLEIRSAALDLIEGQRRPNEYVGYLKAALRDSEPRLRLRALRLLASDCRDHSVFVVLKSLVHDDDPKIRRLVIESLARYPNPEIIEPFFERLPHEDRELRTLILGTLQKLTKTSQSLIEKHLLPFLADENPAMRDMAAKLLAQMPDPTHVLRSFLIHAKSLACWLRERSIDSIGKMSDDLTPTLVSLMTDEDADVRVGAMMMASRTRDARILPHVQEIFLGDGDWWIRSLAADILGNFPTEEVTQLLLSRFDDPDLRYSVIGVLGRHRNALSRKALIACLRHQERGLRVAALEACEDSADPATLSTIAELTADADPMVRQKAAAALQKKGIDDASPKPPESADPVPQDLDLEMENEILNP